MKISSQYAKLYLAHVQVAKPITPRNKQVFRKLDEPVLLHKILKKKWYSNPSRRDGTQQCLAVRY